MPPLAARSISPMAPPWRQWTVFWSGTASAGHGLERGQLTVSIIAAVSKGDKGREERWEKLWADPVACRYRRVDHADFWVWSHDFFEAPVEDLRHIAALIGVGAKGARRR